MMIRKADLVNIRGLLREHGAIVNHADVVHLSGIYG